MMAVGPIQIHPADLQLPALDVMDRTSLARLNLGEEMGAHVLQRCDAPAHDWPWAPPLPHCTTTPGLGSAKLLSPQDFVVEEVASYLPCGEGEHVYLWLEKCLLTSVDVQKMLARHCRIPSREIGMAGQKDAMGITRQWFSLPIRATQALASFQHPSIRLLEQGRHRNKLRMGHLRGNVFSITLHDLKPHGLPRAQATLAQLMAQGLRNGYGPQRFDRKGDGLASGHRLLRGTALGGSSLKSPRLRRFQISVVQAALFNCWLLYRYRMGLDRKIYPGDVVQRKESGGLFVSCQPEQDTQRLAQGEVMLTGPMYGASMFKAQGMAGRLEEWISFQHGLTDKHWQHIGHWAPGTRRAAWVDVHRAEVQQVSPTCLKVIFQLPAGAYASLVVAELCKAQVCLPPKGLPVE